MMDSSTFSTAGVETIHRERAAVIDLTHGWPDAEQLLGGDPGPVWDVDAPLDRPVSVTVIGPDARLRVDATTIRLHLGVDGTMSVVGLTRPFDDRDAAADEVRRTAQAAGMEEAPTDALVARLASGPVERRRRHGLRAGEALGVRVGLTVHRMPARADVPALEVLEWSVTPLESGPSTTPEAPAETEESQWLRL